MVTADEFAVDVGTSIVDPIHNIRVLQPGGAPISPCTIDHRHLG